MAKQPETVDRIVIMAEAPTLEMVGGGLAALTRLGFENVGYKLITDVLKYKNRKVHEVSASEFAAAFVKENARFKIGDLVTHFKDAGRAPSGAYDAAKRLLKARVVAKSGDDYVRVEAVTGPKGSTAKPAKSARGQQRPYDIPNIVLITRTIKGRKSFTLRMLRDLFVKEGRPEKSISPILSKLSGAKVIKQVGNGEYTVLAKPKPKPKPAKKPAAAAPVLNGSGVNANG